MNRLFEEIINTFNRKKAKNKDTKNATQVVFDNGNFLILLKMSFKSLKSNYLQFSPIELLSYEKDFQSKSLSHYKVCCEDYCVSVLPSSGCWYGVLLPSAYTGR